jgi:hypothetical protein
MNGGPSSDISTEDRAAGNGNVIAVVDYDARRLQGAGRCVIARDSVVPADPNEGPKADYIRRGAGGDTLAIESAKQNRV